MKGAVERFLNFCIFHFFQLEKMRIDNAIENGKIILVVETQEIYL